MHKLKFVSYSPVNLSYVNFTISPSTRTQEWWMQKFLPPWQWHAFLYGSHWERKSTRGIWTMGSESRGIQSKSVSLSPLYAEPQRKHMIRNWEILKKVWIVLGTLLSHLPSVPRWSPHYWVLPWWKAWCCSIPLDVQLSRLCPLYPPKYWFQMSLSS